MPVPDGTVCIAIASFNHSLIHPEESLCIVGIQWWLAGFFNFSGGHLKPCIKLSQSLCVFVLDIGLTRENVIELAHRVEINPP